LVTVDGDGAAIVMTVTNTARARARAVTVRMTRVDARRLARTLTSYSRGRV
jgi:hypothetical protein